MTKPGAKTKQHLTFVSDIVKLDIVIDKNCICTGGQNWFNFFIYSQSSYLTNGNTICLTAALEEAVVVVVVVVASATELVALVVVWVVVCRREPNFTFQT